MDEGTQELLMNSVQLVLLLEDRTAPWGGRSPRELTRAYKTFTFRAGTGRVDHEPIVATDSVQLELFPEGTSYGT